MRRLLWIGLCAALGACSPADLDRSERSAARAALAAPSHWLEVVLVNDAARVSQLGGRAATEAALRIANQADALLRNGQLSPLVQLSVVQVANHQADPYTVPPPVAGETSASELLTVFATWVQGASGLPPHDHAMLLSGLDFNGIVFGLAVNSGMGTDQSVSIHDTNRAEAMVAFSLAHQLGHSFGLGHNGDGSTIMSASVSAANLPTLWSDQDVALFAAFFANNPGRAQLLENQPTTILNGFCGDGTVSGAEVCDCGASDCTALDPCCDGSSCQLVSGAFCSDLEPCCSGCAPIAASAQTVCRPSRGECDIEELCLGVSGACPGDRWQEAGSACSGGNGSPAACLAGRCVDYHQACVEAGARGYPGSYRYDAQCQGGINSQGCGRLVCYREDTAMCLGLTSLQPWNGSPCEVDGLCIDGSCLPLASVDECPDNPDKARAGACGCQQLDTDSDGDTLPDCHDLCPLDGTKTEPGRCGCGVAEDSCVDAGQADAGDQDAGPGADAAVGVDAGVPADSGATDQAVAGDAVAPEDAAAADHASVDAATADATLQPDAATADVATPASDAAQGADTSSAGDATATLDTGVSPDHPAPGDAAAAADSRAVDAVAGGEAGAADATGMDSASPADSAGPVNPPDPGCGCAAQRGTTPRSGLVGLLLALPLVSWRRRALRLASTR